MGRLDVESSARAPMCLLLQHHNPICSFPHLQGVFFYPPPRKLMLDLKEETRGGSRDQRASLREAAPAANSIPTQKKSWDGRI